MSVAAPVAPRSLFRGREDAMAHSAALGLAGGGWLASFALMAAGSWIANLCGVLLCAQSMVLAAYLIHEAAHQTLFVSPRMNQIAGETMNFVAGGCYASFARIMHMHIRHHVDRVDPICFDLKGLLQRRPALRRTLQVLEWAYVPAVEILMHLQVVWRPFWVRSQHAHLPRVLAMLGLRGVLLAALWSFSPRAVALYAVALLLQLHVLNFFDAFHHTFDQVLVEPHTPIPMDGRDRIYEQANTYSNVISLGHPWLNLLVLNFGYHNAHHHRPSVSWWRLPALHRKTYGADEGGLMPVAELLATWHRNRLRRVFAADYGAPAGGAPVEGASVEGPSSGHASAAGAGRADGFVGAHGVSFLTVV
jgi:fatty acid desaturase